MTCLYVTRHKGNKHWSLSSMRETILTRFKRRSRGYHDAKAFLSPGQTALVFLAGTVLVIGLVGVVLYTMFATVTAHQKPHPMPTRLL
jgi:uncharacterized iron-regulated membrane protein